MRLAPSLVLRIIVVALLGMGVLALLAWLTLSQAIVPHTQSLAEYVPSTDTPLFISSTDRAAFASLLEESKRVFALASVPPTDSIAAGQVYEFGYIRTQSGGIEGWAVESRTIDPQTKITAFKILTSDARISTLLKATYDAKQSRLSDALFFASTSPLMQRGQSLFLRPSLLPNASGDPADTLLRALLAPFDTLALGSNGDASGWMQLHRRTQLGTPPPFLVTHHVPILQHPAFVLEASQPAVVLRRLRDTLQNADPALGDGLTGIVSQWWIDHFPHTTVADLSPYLQNAATLELGSGSLAGTFVWRGSTQQTKAGTHLLSLLSDERTITLVRRQQFSPEYGRTDVVARDARLPTERRQNGWLVTTDGTGSVGIAMQGRQFIATGSGTLLARGVDDADRAAALPANIAQDHTVLSGSADPAFLAALLHEHFPFLSPLPPWADFLHASFLPRAFVVWSWAEDGETSTAAWSQP